MSEELKPGAETTPDVLEGAEVATPEVQEETTPNYAEMSLAELSQQFETLSESEDRMKKSKEAEAIKAAFYKRLSKEKAAAGMEASEETSENEAPEVEETTEEKSELQIGRASCRERV